MSREIETCRNKVGYGTWASAQHGARETNRANRLQNEPRRMHVYRCPVCGGIHVGAERPKRRPQA